MSEAPTRNERIFRSGSSPSIARRAEMMFRGSCIPSTIDWASASGASTPITRCVPIAATGMSAEHFSLAARTVKPAQDLTVEFLAGSAKGANTILVGAQWGDEGKGKIIDFLTESADLVVRSQGGNNAGHTIKVGNDVFKLHVTPSGVIQGKIGVIGNGVVIDPAVLLKEMAGLNERGVDTSKLVISANAHLITPYHVTLDKVTERFLGKSKIGTTGRGIGPTYADKISRVGIRVQDLFDEKILRAKIEGALTSKNQVLAKVYNRLPFSAAEITDFYIGTLAPRIAPMIADTASNDPCQPSGQSTCQAKKSARFRITPTTAAVIADSGAVKPSLP